MKRMSIAMVLGFLVIAGGRRCAAQPVPGLNGSYSCGFDSSGYTPADTQESVDVSGIFSLAISGSSVTQSVATLSVSDGGAGSAVCTYTNGSGSIANDPSAAGFDTAALTYEPSKSNSSLCPPGSTTLTLTPVNRGIDFSYSSTAGFVGSGTCGPAGTPTASAFYCRYMINNPKGSGVTEVLIAPPLEAPASGQRQAFGLAADTYPQNPCPYTLTGTAVYPLPGIPMQGDWLIGGPTLKGCPEIPAMGEVSFTTTKDTILVTSPQVSSVVCTVPVIIGILQASPNQIDFGLQKVKTTTSRPIMVTNVGFGPVTITDVSSSKPNVFGESDNCKGVLQTRSSCTVTSTFTPGSKGKLQGSLTISNNGDPVTIGLAGKGT